MSADSILFGILNELILKISYEGISDFEEALSYQRLFKLEQKFVCNIDIYLEAHKFSSSMVEIRKMVQLFSDKIVGDSKKFKVPLDRDVDYKKLAVLFESSHKKQINIILPSPVFFISK